MPHMQHPCYSCCLTPLHTHSNMCLSIYLSVCLSVCLFIFLSIDLSIYRYSFQVKVPHCHALICLTPLPFFTHFFLRLFLLSSSSPVFLTTTTMMIHLMNHKQIFEGFSPHIFLSPPFPFYPSLFSLALFLPLHCSFLLFFLFSKFQSAAGRVCFFSTSESKRSQNIRGNVKQPLSTSRFFLLLFSPSQPLCSVPAGCKSPAL